MQKIALKKKELSYAVTEEIKYLRANIQFSGADKKVILLTSVAAHEGKSTTTLRLARSLAELGKRVLLIDADLRRSALRNELVSKSEVRKGLTHFLSGMASVDEVLCMTDEPVMYMIFAGPVPPNPSELLANTNMDTLLDWGREQFDYVLIDTAPLGTVIDAAALAPRCDGAAVVIEAGRIPYKAAQSVVQQLQDAECPVMGVVLNKVDTGVGKRYYNSYRKYGYEYQSNKKSSSKSKE